MNVRVKRGCLFQIATMIATTIAITTQCFGQEMTTPKIYGEEWPIFSSKIPTEIQTLIRNDFSFLEGQLPSFSQSNDALSRLFPHWPIDQIKNEELLTWPIDRIHYIVEDGFYERAIKTHYNSPVAYPYKNEFPTIEESFEPAQSPSSADTPKPKKMLTVMSNVGMAFYLEGKYSASWRSVLFLGQNQTDAPYTIPIHSPRVGIIQMGEFLFEGASYTPLTSKLLRLETLFHEARHSDGHGKSLGFTHAVCPYGHIYQGKYACDRNLNGPYTMSVGILQLFRDHCEQLQCTLAEKLVLEVSIEDLKSRIIWSTPKEKIVDEVVLKQIDELNKRIDGLMNMLAHDKYGHPGTIRNYEKRIKAAEDELEKVTREAKKEIISITPSTSWDDEPEISFL